MLYVQKYWTESVLFIFSSSDAAMFYILVKK